MAGHKTVIKYFLGSQSPLSPSHVAWPGYKKRTKILGSQSPVPRVMQHGRGHKNSYELLWAKVTPLRVMQHGRKGYNEKCYTKLIITGPAGITPGPTQSAQQQAESGTASRQVCG
jgi:hypothetical protein